MRLHGYWRSGAAYRVRIALGLKGVAHEQVSHDLRTGAQASPEYARLNPQRLVPALEVDGQVLTQSGAIVEWLEERFPDPPLLPADPLDRATVRGMVLLIAADIHPLHNLRILKSLKADLGLDEAASNAWVGRWIADGLAALEVQVARQGDGFCHRNRPTIADCFLLPQLLSAERFGADLSPYPRLLAVRERMDAIPAVAAAHPARQPDADPA